MRLVAFLGILFLLPACSLFQKQGKLTDPEGRVYMVEIPDDTVLSIKEKDKEILFDTRGHTGLIENIITLGLVKTNLDVNVGHDDAD